MKISFVVLHYESIYDTVECIESILNLNSDCIQIIAVDNGSKKNKLKIIENNYKHCSNITFLYSNENLGFAKGNNLGFLYAKKFLHSDGIILCNNDLIFRQKEFIKVLEKSIFKIEVAGPKIISLVDGKNQNPVQYLYPDVHSVNIRIIKFYILYFLSYFGLDAFFKKIFAKEIIEFTSYKNDDYQLHGACLIFGPSYIKRFDGLYDGTFMYMEESILKWRCNYYDLKMEYIPELVVFHKEGSSTEKIYGEGRKKRQFYYKWNIRGCKLLKSIMDSVPDKGKS